LNYILYLNLLAALVILGSEGGRIENKEGEEGGGVGGKS